MDFELNKLLELLKENSEDFAIGRRNQIKTIVLADKKLNVKLFKIPSLLSGIIYKFFRKSKAKRSFEFALKLKECGIGTPNPIAYFENSTWLRLKDSYYVCEHIDYDNLFRDFMGVSTEDPTHRKVLQLFTELTFKMHEAGIEFLDHSPGNTLIKKVGENEFELYLVDLNRMKFHKSMDFETRMNNLKRISPNKMQIETISEFYAGLYGKSKNEVFDVLWGYTSAFQRKSILKSKINKFIRKK